MTEPELSTSARRALAAWAEHTSLGPERKLELEAALLGRLGVEAKAAAAAGAGATAPAGAGWLKLVIGGVSIAGTIAVAVAVGRSGVRPPEPSAAAQPASGSAPIARRPAQAQAQPRPPADPEPISQPEPAPEAPVSPAPIEQAASGPGSDPAPSALGEPRRRIPRVAARERAGGRAAPPGDRGADTEPAPAPVRPAQPGRSEPAADADALSREVLALRQAAEHNRAGRYAQALAALDGWESAHRTGALAEARAVARAIALCGLGDLRALDQVRARFLARYPSSAHRERVESLCR